ncbi:MAG: SH3 domain-containing protein [Rubellimicrobium sp.]|nr:SH3 domain-containing protein [Rubellimicrobium sp.]
MKNLSTRALSLVLLALLAGCTTGTGISTGGAGSETVGNLRGEEFLRMRAGPGLGFAVILGLPEGTAVTRRSCVTEAGQLWCRIDLADWPNVRGYVSADYLIPR